MQEKNQSIVAELQTRIEELEAVLGRKQRRLRRLGGRASAVLGVVVLAVGVALIPSFAGAAAPFWSLDGTTGTNPTTNYLGTADNAGLSIRTDKTQAIGIDGSQNVTVEKGLTARQGVTFGDGTTQTTAGVTGVNASGPLSSSGGTRPTIGLGTVGTGNGGTGLTTGPSQAGQFLRSTGSGTWGIGGLQASDVPDLSGSYARTDGSNATGTWPINTSGNATTATSFTGSLKGDVTGTQGSTTVVGLNGSPITGMPSNGQVLEYNGTTGTWEPHALSGGYTPDLVVVGQDVTVPAPASGGVYPGIYAGSVSCPVDYAAVKGAFQLDNDNLEVVEGYPSLTGSDSTVSGNGFSNSAWRYKIENWDMSTSSAPGAVTGYGTSHGASLYVICLSTR